MMSQTVIDRESLPDVRGSYRENADLSRTNWFNVGGCADILFRPQDAADLQYFLSHCPKDTPVTVLGVGSNLLVRDGGIEGIVIKLGKGFTQVNKLDSNTIKAGTGALSFNVANACAEYGIAGLEFLIGIPGTIGGNIHMNAGAYGSDIATILIEAKALDRSGGEHILSPSDLGFIYRGHTFPEPLFFTEVTLQGHAESSETIKNRMEQISTKRSETQPVRERTSGSTFKNPAGQKAWQLIDEAGCRGLKIGGAQVSPKHCNFFINTGNATAHDIETLGEEVRKRVFENSGISLEWEIQIIGRSE